MSYTDSRMKSCRSSRSRPDVPRSVTADQMKEVELVHVGPPLSLITHYLLYVPATETYYHADFPRGISTMSASDYKNKYTLFRTQISRQTFYPEDKIASAAMLNKYLRLGYSYNLADQNCIDFAWKVITGERHAPITKQVVHEIHTKIPKL
jgi:hypothetical protein